MSPRQLWTPFCVLLALSIASGTSLAAEKGRVVQPLGKTLDGWAFKGNAEKSLWKIGVAKMNPDSPRELIVAPATEQAWELVNAGGHGVDIATEAEFGDCTVELEMMVPQGSNSGIYLMGQYEIQVLDSFGREKVGPGDLGGIYSAAPPKLNAAKAPGEWQTFASRCDHDHELQIRLWDESDAPHGHNKFCAVRVYGQQDAIDLHFLSDVGTECDRYVLESRHSFEPLGQLSKTEP